MRQGLVAVAVLALAPGLAAQEGAAVRVELSDARPPEVYITLHRLLDDDRFVAAMESGFPLHVAYEVELRQSRSLWDRTVARVEWEYVVLFDPVRERFVLEDPDGTEVLPDREHLRDRIAQVYLLRLDADEAGEFYYHVAVDARTLDDKDVDEVYEWLKGENADSLRLERPGFIARAARSLLVRVAPLPRVSVEGSSRRFRRP